MSHRAHRAARRWGAGLFVGMLLSATMALMGGTVAAADTAPGSAFPPLPTYSASPATWRSWAHAQGNVIRAVPWTAYMSAHGCSVSSLAFEQTPTPSGLGNIPPGVEMTSVSMVARCVSSTTDFSSQQGTSSPSASTSETCGGIAGPGTACVGPATVNGNPNYMFASYEYQGGSSATGYVELGNVGISPPSCSPGSEVASSPVKTLSPGATGILFWGPRSISTTWSSTWWEGSTSPYTDWGSVCGVY